MCFDTTQRPGGTWPLYQQLFLYLLRCLNTQTHAADLAIHMYKGNTTHTHTHTRRNNITLDA